MRPARFGNSPLLKIKHKGAPMTAIIPEAIAFEITKASIGALVKPAIGAVFSGLKSLASSTISSFGERFADYATIQAERHSKLNTIVLGHQKLLHDLYIPLTLITGDKSSKNSSEQKSILIDRLRTELLPKEDRILITDTAGMGKSTLSKFLFLQSLRAGFAVPIFLELRHLSIQTTALALIQRQLNTAPISEDEPKFAKRQVERVFHKGGLLIIFDGYDEIPFKDREAVTSDLKDFIAKYPKNYFIITSRPETGLLAFPAFKRFNIRSLNKDESFALIRKYDAGGGRAEQLISKLDGKDFKAVQEFLKNPLLTSLLYRSFEYKQSVAIKKHVFYRQVFDALFEWHDATKDGYNTREKRSGLDMDTFHRVLRIVGFVSIMKGQVEGDTDTILSWIRSAKEVCSNCRFAESDFLDDLVRAVPIFAKDGDYYRWSHKSLAEYFAAQYICTEGKAQQGQLLTAFTENGKGSRFANVLDQIYDIDIIAFRTHLVAPLSASFREYWLTAYKSIDADIGSASIRMRKEVAFDRTLVITLLPQGNTREPLLAITEALQLQGEKLNAEAASDFFPILLDHTERGSARLIGILGGEFAPVLSILKSKRDDLIRIAGAPELRGVGVPRLNVKALPLVLSDDPKLDANRPEYFDKITRLLSDFVPTIDSSKMLGFEAAFQDGAKLERLADDLLSSLKK